MVEHAAGFAAAGIPYIFDPGQGLPMFSGGELLDLIAGAAGLTVNDYEWRIVEQKTGKSLEDIAALVDCLVVTRGAEGSSLWTGGRRHEVAAVRPDAVVDPTGCGDAYRAGLLFGRARGWEWLKSARLASVMGAIKIAHRGGQNHRPTREGIGRHLRENFAETL